MFVLVVFLHLCILKRVIYENKLAVTSRKRGGRVAKLGKGIKRYKLLYTKQIRYKDVMHSTGSAANIL